MCASTNYLDSAMNSTFYTSGVALTATMDSSIAHTSWEEKEKRRWEWERKPDRMSLKYKKEEAGLEVSN